VAIKLQTDPERLRPLDFISGDVPQNDLSFRDPSMKSTMTQPTNKRAAFDKTAAKRLVHD
jgi:hypothetical protein